MTIREYSQTALKQMIPIWNEHENEAERSALPLRIESLYYGMYLLIVRCHLICTSIFLTGLYMVSKFSL